MNAEDAEALFSAAYDDELDPEQRREFEQTLQRDPALAQRYSDFCQTIETLKHADETVPTPDLLRGVQRRLRNQSGGRFYSDRFAERSGMGSQQLLMMALLATTLLLLAIGALFAYFSGVSILP